MFEFCVDWVDNHEGEEEVEWDQVEVALEDEKGLGTFDGLDNIWRVDVVFDHEVDEETEDNYEDKYEDKGIFYFSLELFVVIELEHVNYREKQEAHQIHNDYRQAED